MSVEVDGPQVEHGLGAVDGPSHTRLFQPIFHHVSAGAFGHAAADWVAGGQVFVVAHVPAVVFVVADGGRDHASPRAAESVLVAQPFEASDYIAYLSRQQQPQVVRDKLLGLVASFAMKHVGRLPYLCSIRTMYRLLDAAQEVRERRDQLRHPQYHKPELLATGPNQVWSWDITKLLGPAKWSYFYLYVIMDIFSRYVVGWTLAQQESGQLAQRLIRETCVKENIAEGQLTIHADRGTSMTSQTVAQLLATLGVVKSHSRPQVSNDNPFSESQFKTLKYRPEFPQRFASYDHGLTLCREFFPWVG